MLEIIKEFLLYCEVERRLAANTVQSYRSDLRHYQDFLAYSKTLANNQACAKEYLRHLLIIQGLSTTTARRRMACLRAFYAFAADRHKWVNPFSNWSPELKRPKRLPRALSREDVQTLVKSNKNIPIDDVTRFAIVLISATGVRVSELCAILLRDVVADGSAIRIFGKGSKERVVYIGSDALKLELKVWRDERLKQSNDNEHLLLNSRGAPLQPQTLRRRIHRLREASGLERVVTPHMLRHTAATLLIESGIDIRFVQRLLGHSSIATTEIYTHVTDTSLQRAIIQANALAGISWKH